MSNKLKVRLFGVLLSIDIIIEYLRSLTTETAMSIDNKTTWPVILTLKVFKSYHKPSGT